MDHLLKKISDSMDTVVKKVDEYGNKITELTVKVDMYREHQQEHSRKIEQVDRQTTEALASTRSAHKRLDTIESDSKWMKRAVITMALSIIGGIIAALFKI